MKAIKITEPGIIQINEVPDPKAGLGEVLIRLKYVGFCGSDLSTFRGKNPMVQYPRVPGHEISAVIEDAGEGVPAEFTKGDAVTVVPYSSCGQCPSCRRGREYACRNNQTLGVQRDGAMQELLALPWEKLVKAPGLDALELAMVEPLTVGFHAIQRGEVSKEDTVMVIGCGMIGVGAIIGAVKRGARVIAVDVDEHKLAKARSLGVESVINSKSVDLHRELSHLTNGDGPDVVIEAVGSPATYRAAIDEVAFTGRVVCIGYAADEVMIATKLFVQKELDVRGSRNASAEDFREVIRYLEQGNFPMDQMLSKKVRPEEVAAAIKEWADEPGKVMKILLDFT